MEDTQLTMNSYNGDRFGVIVVTLGTIHVHTQNDQISTEMILEYENLVRIFNDL